MTCAVDAIFLALLTILNFIVGKRRILYPPLIYSLVWFAATALFWVAPIQLNEVHAITWWVIALGAFAFSVGGWITALLPQSLFALRMRVLSHPTASSFGRVVLLAICILAVPIMLNDILSRGGGGGFGQVFMNARDASVSMAGAGQSHSYIIANLPVFSILVAVICLIEQRDRIFWIALLSSLACCVLSTGRTYVLMLFAALAATQMLKNRQDNVSGLLRIGLLPLLAFFVLFIGLVFVNKDVSNFEGTGAILTNFVLAYFVVPIPALDYVLTHSSEYTHAAHHTFALLLNIFSALGFSVNVPSAFDSYVFVPLPTNVYTVYKFYFTDFGLIGALGGIIAIAFLQTVVYRRATNNGNVSVFFCSILVFPAILSIFDDAYSGYLLLMIKAGILALVYWGALNRMHIGMRIPHLQLRLWMTGKRNEA